MVDNEKKEKIGNLNKILNNKYLRFILIFGLLGIFISTFIYFNPWSVIENHNTIVFLSLFIVILLTLCIFYFVTNYKSNTLKDQEGNQFIDFFSDNAKKDFFNLMMKFLITLAFIIGLVCLIIFLFIFIKNFKDTALILKNILLFLIIVITLSIIYLVLEVLFKDAMKTSKNNRSFLNLIKDIIFFIPCLLIEFIKYLEHEISITTNPIWILLILEIIVILVYFYIPVISKKIVNNDSIRLLEGPIFTNNEIVLGNFQNLKGDDNFNYNFTISLDIWINPQPANTNFNYNKYSSLFNYANKPNILYNGQTNTIRIIYENKINEIETVYESNSFPYQSWINFVIILRASTLDIFINRKLVVTVQNILPYMKNDSITAGKKDGINGGIKNILYFNRPLDLNEIRSIN